MTPFIIYARAVGIYCLLTLPAITLPIMYLVSVTYVLIYGWFAWALFTIIYFITVFAIQISFQKCPFFLWEWLSLSQCPFKCLKY
jgi:hypothetical protein